MKVKDIMTKNPRCCAPGTSLEEVAKIMCNSNVGEVPVVESEQNRKIKGVITDRDITCRSLAQGKNPLELAARDCMSSPAITVTPETSVDACCQLLEKHQIRRVPVIDRENRCVGIVAQADIALKCESTKTAEVVREVSQVA